MGSSSRGIQSGGLILTKEDLLDKEYFNTYINSGKTTLLYAKSREYLQNVKSMQLEEFEELFEGHLNTGEMDHLLGIDGSECYFRKEIEKKYGKKDDRPKKHYTTMYKEGDCIIDSCGRKRVYMGEFEYFKLELEGVVTTLSGHFYCYLDDAEDIESFKKSLQSSNWNFTRRRKQFGKTKRKAETDAIYFEGSPIPEKEGHLSIIIPKSYLYSYERTLNVSYKKK